jgi:hypothetical protein
MMALKLQVGSDRSYSIDFIVQCLNVFMRGHSIWSVVRAKQLIFWFVFF